MGKFNKQWNDDIFHFLQKKGFDISSGQTYFLEKKKKKKKKKKHFKTSTADFFFFFLPSLLKGKGLWYIGHSKS